MMTILNRHSPKRRTLADEAIARRRRRGAACELRGDGIDVCTVIPPSIDTPLFQHAANVAGRPVKSLRPILRLERVAPAIVRCAKPRGTADLLVDLEMSSISDPTGSPVRA